MSVGMRCCIKVQENLLAVSKQSQIFHMLYVLSKPCPRISCPLSLIDGIATLLNTLSILLVERTKFS